MNGSKRLAAITMLLFIYNINLEFIGGVVIMKRYLEGLKFGPNVITRVEGRT